ncbi:LAMI_0A07822g1_1 [Lachancea mirantina]|uniref:GPI mannosyltransferase 1 n=1 Tax=Lachancea mirantina TaxID=1230905 RepID=A0A1G4IQZ8_9SACH|nr:LAMI_0A07822g1_1 [Lachancea mirantina]
MELSTIALFLGSFTLRIGFFLYGIYQDAHFEVKYTDIDYFVFNDAAKYAYYLQSPFLRDTYRYTPLLSWLLVPNHYFKWIHFGKMIFIGFDLLTGILIVVLLDCTSERRRKLLASLWLLNFMVITISTRGNAESVVCCLVVLTMYFLKIDNFVAAGIAYGTSIHFKLYPVMYCLPIAVFIYQTRSRSSSWFKNLIKIGISTATTAAALTFWMYKLYGYEYLDNAYLYHFYRTDHRHNFSLWNMLLYLDSATLKQSSWPKLAFVPQAAVTIALSFLLDNTASLSDLMSILFFQTFTFVAYNKVCTSQYFIWYLTFLPFYLQDTQISRKKGLFMLFLWVASQAFWLSQAYLLEFKGKNVFFNIFVASVSFFISNIWILGQMVEDHRIRNHSLKVKKSE